VGTYERRAEAKPRGYVVGGGLAVRRPPSTTADWQTALAVKPRAAYSDSPGGFERHNVSFNRKEG
jgi:hypothetical protein